MASPTGMINNSLLGLFPPSRRIRIRLRGGEKPFYIQFHQFYCSTRFFAHSTYKQYAFGDKENGLSDQIRMRCVRNYNERATIGRPFFL